MSVLKSVLTSDLTRYFQHEVDLVEVIPVRLMTIRPQIRCLAWRKGPWEVDADADVESHLQHQPRTRQGRQALKGVHAS